MSALRRPFLSLIPRCSLLPLKPLCPNLLKVSTGKTAGENDNEVKTESDEVEPNDREEKKEDGEEVEMAAAERKEELGKFPYFRIEMSILNGRELIAMDRGGTSDPYVKVVQVSRIRIRSCQTQTKAKLQQLV